MSALERLITSSYPRVSFGLEYARARNVRKIYAQLTMYNSYYINTRDNGCL